MRDWADYERERGYVRIDLRVLTPEEGGRPSGKAIFTEYRSCWDIGNTYEGGPMFNDAPLVLEGGTESLAPGERGTARIHPIAPEYWGGLQAGTTMYAHEGSRRVAVAVVLEIVLPESSV